ncbi:MAG: helix-turn-helix domain-containing protein [Bacteroidales bacterium]
MSAYIFDLIRQGEHDMLDFKHSIANAKKIAKSLVAFANTNGGKLLIGVKDNGTISGIRSEEEFYMIETAAHMFCKPEIKFSTETWYIDGKTVLEITIPKSLNKIYYAKDSQGKWKVYIRVDDKIFLANRVLLKVWKQRRRKRGTYVRYEETEQLLLNFLSENDMITFNKFRKIANISPYKAERILVNLIVLNLIDIVFTDNGTFYTLKKT